jgi:hypothetical protein
MSAQSDLSVVSILSVPHVYASWLPSFKNPKLVFREKISNGRSKLQAARRSMTAAARIGCEKNTGACALLSQASETQRA